MRGSNPHKGSSMTKPELLALIRLLSSVETALLCHKVSLPDHLWESITETCERIEREIFQ